MNACILTIGDELLQGFTTDTNSTWLAKTLLSYNINIIKTVTIGDDHGKIVTESQKILQENYDLFFVTGGLGPTHDDVTKKAYCELFCDEMYFDHDYYSQLIKKYETIGKKIPKINKSQAMLLKNADSIPNASGSALGIHSTYKNTHVFIMPGVPIEMQDMVNNYIIPNYINNECKKNYITIKTAGIAESRLAEKIEPLMNKFSDSLKFAFLPHYTGVSFRIRKKNNRVDLADLTKKFFNVMQPYAYGYDEDSIEKILGERLIKKKLTIAVAESCTGGLIGQRLTNIAGSSKYFLGSITAYSNQLKIDLLNVCNNTIKNNGSVSEEVALEMANGIRNKTHADIGISTTGISGPDGGNDEKPIGLVYIGYSTANISKVKKYVFIVKRIPHREMTATAALNITRLAIEK